MQPTLVIMAAGMGSRYGGLKQLDRLGPNGETIMDYSIYDALRSGFGEIVFVIRESFSKEFNRVCVSRYGSHFLSGSSPRNWIIYRPFFSSPGREKPWGTGHALLTTGSYVDTPFGIINADDFYGHDAFRVLSGYLTQKNLTEGSYAMVGYRLENTLSPSGPVSRGVCKPDRNGLLTDVVERHKIRKEESGKILCSVPGNNGEVADLELDPGDLCSMNCWGFYPTSTRKPQSLFRNSSKGTYRNPPLNTIFPRWSMTSLRPGRYMPGAQHKCPLVWRNVP